jgi:hypothetical protein
MWWICWRRSQVPSTALSPRGQKVPGSAKRSDGAGHIKQTGAEDRSPTIGSREHRSAYPSRGAASGGPSPRIQEAQNPSPGLRARHPLVFHGDACPDDQRGLPPRRRVALLESASDGRVVERDVAVRPARPSHQHAPSRSRDPRRRATVVPGGRARASRARADRFRSDGRTASAARAARRPCCATGGPYATVECRGPPAADGVVRSPNREGVREPRGGSKFGLSYRMAVW